MDFGGVDDVQKGLRNLPKMEHFLDMKAVLVVRDAEGNVEAAVNALQYVLQDSVNASVDKFGKLTISDDGIKVGFVLLPGVDNKGEFVSGTLEDLCLKILKPEKAAMVLGYTDSCLEQIKQDVYADKEYKTKHKNRLHAYFSATDRFVGMKIGEVAKSGAFDFGNKALEFLKKALQEMVEE